MELDVQGMWHVWGRGNMHRGFWWGHLKETPLRKPRHRGGGIILKWILFLIRCGWGACTGLLRLRIGASGELLCTW